MARISTVFLALLALLPVAEAEPPVLRGDVSLDARVSAVDGLAILSASVEKALPEGWVVDPLGDVDCDGSIDATDALVVLRYVVGLDVSGTCLGHELLEIVTAELPDAAQDAAYSATVSALGGEGARSWSITAGALPAGLAIDGASGEITGTATATGASLFTVHVSADDGQADARELSITVNEPSHVIWSTTGDGTAIATIEPTTGLGTVVGNHGYSQGWAGAFDLGGTLYTLVGGFSGNAILATVDPATGVATTIGTGLGTDMISLEFDAAGTLYGIGYYDGLLYEIDPVAGTASSIGNTGITYNMDLAFDSGGTLYATYNNQLWTVDTTTGAATSLGAISGVCAGGTIMGIMFDASDVLYATNYAVDTQSCLMTIDVGTMTATVVGLTGLSYPHGGDIY